jgi:hypothetical protein
VTLSTRALKVISGAGALAICGVSGVLVAIDPKPATAPLRPALIGVLSSTPPALLIPPSCDQIGARSGGESPTLDPSLLPLVAEMQAAMTAAERRAILASLTADQRLQIEAYVRAVHRKDAACASEADGSGSGAARATIAPSVVDAPPSGQPLINTYVS